MLRLRGGRSLIGILAVVALLRMRVLHGNGLRLLLLHLMLLGLLMRLLCLCHGHLRGVVWHDPAYDACQEVIADLSAVAQVDLF